MIVRLLKILVHYILLIIFDILLFNKCLQTNILSDSGLLTFKVLFGIVSAHPATTAGSGLTDDVSKALHWQSLLQILLLLLFFLLFLHRSLLIFIIDLHLNQVKKNIPSDAWTGRDLAKSQRSHIIQYSMSYTWLLVLHTSRSASGFFCRIYDQKYIHWIVYCLKKLIINYLMSHFIHIFCIRLQEED